MIKQEHIMSESGAFKLHTASIYAWKTAYWTNRRENFVQ